MGRWKVIQLERQTDGQIYRWKDKQMNRQTDSRWTDRQMERHTGGQIDRWKDNQTHRQMERQTDGQIDVHIDMMDEETGLWTLGLTDSTMFLFYLLNPKFINF